MAEIQVYDCLYNKFSKEFRDKYKKMNCWATIGRKFSITAQEAENKFKNLRSSYTRFLRKMTKLPSGSGRDAVSCPPECQGLEWLKPYIQHRPSATNLTTSTKHWSNLSSPQSCSQSATTENTSVSCVVESLSTTSDND